MLQRRAALQIWVAGVAGHGLAHFVPVARCSSLLLLERRFDFLLIGRAYFRRQRAGYKTIQVGKKVEAGDIIVPGLGKQFMATHMLPARG